MSVRVFSQAIGIGASVFTPDPSAMLEVQATNKGILIPRVALTQTTSSSPITSPATSLMVYNTATVNDVTPGYYYWDGSQWVRLLDGSSSSDGWLTLGNAGTNPATHFVGTTDSVDLVFRTNNTEKMRITASGNVGIGTTAPTARLYVRTTDLTTGPFQVEALIGFDSVLMPGWSYRKSIPINNTQNSNTLTDYQVLIILNTQDLISAGKMRSDCGDIRFTDSDGSTLLNYWIESGCNTATTKIWVKVPSIPANSTKTIYVYYGNPSANSLSNGDATFDFFDDFLGTSLNTSKWTVLNSSNAGVSVSNSIFTITITSTSGGYYQIRSNNALQFGIIIESRVNASGTNGCRGWMPAFSTGTGIIRYDNDIPYGDYYAGVYLSNGADNYPGWSFGVRTADGSSTLATKSNFYGSGFNTWLRNRLIVTQSYQQAFIYDDNWNLLASSASSSNTLPSATYYLDLGNMWYNAGGTYSFQYDWARVRKYTSPEPTTSVGTEEPVQQQQTVFYIQNQTGNVGIGTTSPGYKLHVKGDVFATGVVYCNSSALCSDERWKTNIKPIQNALDNVLKIQGVTYHWKVDEYPDKHFSKNEQIGFIAQEVEKIYPQVVLTDKDGYKSIDYSKLTPILVQAIKEQQKIIEKLQAENTQIKTENDQIKAENTQIKAENAQIKSEVKALAEQVNNLINILSAENKLGNK
jgi:hypothetical protein